MTKPLLYIDVDGVLFGQYGEEYRGPQLRGNVVGFIDWCTRYFECRWLTSFPEHKLEQLFRCIYAHHVYERVEYVQWGPDDKEGSVDISSDFYWIEDDPISMHPLLREVTDDNGMNRYFTVNPYGGDYPLVEAKHYLYECLRMREIEVQL